MTWTLGTKVRLRFLLQATGDPASATYQLEYRKNGTGGYAAVPVGSGGVFIDTSSNIAAGATTATTSQLTGGSGTFAAGLISDDTNGLVVDVGNDGNVELEWCLNFASPTISTDSFEFRVTNAGAALASYTATPTLAVDVPGALVATAACGSTVTAALSTSIDLACTLACQTGTPSNYLKRSEIFVNWYPDSTGINSDVAVAPDGTTTADKIKELTGSSAHTRAAPASPGMAANLAGSQVTFSVYAKAVERNWVYLQSVSSGPIAYFDLTSGVVGTVSGTGGSATITSVGGGWYRCALTVASWNGQDLIVGLAAADNTPSYLGVTDSGAYFWGGQFEPGSSAGTYQATYNAAIGTRDLITGIQLAAAISCVSAVTGDIPTSGGAVALVANLVCGSTITITLSTGVRLGSAIACLSSILTANLSTQTRLSGALAGVVTTGAALSTQIKAQTAIAAQSTLGASLSTAIAFGGSTAVVSTLSGALTTAIPLVVSTAAQSAVTGDLSTTPAGLSVGLMCSTAVAASLSTGHLLSASVGGLSTLSAGLTTRIEAGAVVASVAAISANLTIPKDLAASLSSAASTSGSLGTSITLASNLGSASALGASISSGALFYATLQAASTASGALSTSIRLAATTAGVASVTATLDVLSSVGPCDLQASCSLAAALSTGIMLRADCAGEGISQGALTTAINLAAGASSVASVHGSLDTGSSLTAALNASVGMSAAISTGIPLSAALQGEARISADLDTALLLAAALVSRVGVLAAIGSGVYALVLRQGDIKQIDAADVGTGLRPLVLVDGAYLAERQADEGVPVVYNRDGSMETLPFGSQLVV